MFAIMAQLPTAMHYSYMSMIKARVAPLSRTKSKTEQKMAPGLWDIFSVSTGRRIEMAISKLRHVYLNKAFG